MKIKILTLAAGFKEILSAKLNEIGLVAETVDYSQPLLPQLADVDVLVNGLGKVDKSIIDACPKLKLIHQVGIGVDNIDVSYCTAKSIYVANVAEVHSVAVAEHTLFLMIYLAKNVKSAGTSLMKRRVLSVLGSELQEKTLLIIGLGNIGAEVAKRAKSLGMHVIAVTKHPFTKKSADITHFVDTIGGVENLSESLALADFVSIHAQLTDETRGMIGAKEFSLMKRSTFLINVARAAIVDREALFTALTTGKIAGAAFDVFWEEPADPNDKLLKLDNFVLTPHIAGWTVESVDAAARIITTNIDRLSRGETPLTIVNSELVQR